MTIMPDLATLLKNNKKAEGSENRIEGAQRIVSTLRQRGIKQKGYDLVPAFGGSKQLKTKAGQVSK